MNQFLYKIATIIHGLNEWVGRSVAWLTAVLVVIMCTDVTLRYLFNNTKAWIIELEWHLFALIFLLGAGYALKHDRHVRVDLFYDRFSKREQAWINLIGAIVFLIPWCTVLIYFTFQYAHTSYLIGEGSPDPGGLPARYLIKFSVTIGLTLLLLQAIASAIDSYFVLKKE
ncbi:MAG: TRAP transporter small permease subunit [Saprospiraceae bacterium]